MDDLIKNGSKYTLLGFKDLLLENGYDNVHDSIAQLSDSNGYFIISELGVIKLSWDENASTICKYKGDDYYISEFLTIIKNLIK